MRFEVDIEIKGDALAAGETGNLEVARLLMVAGEKVLDGVLAQVPDEVTLRDYNGVPVGAARMVPGWSVGETVWATTNVGECVACTIVGVSPAGLGDFELVACRVLWSGQAAVAIMVDHRGLSPEGKPLLGRAR